MTTPIRARPFRVSLLLVLALGVSLSRGAWAGDDAIPYPDEDSSEKVKKLPRRSDPSYVRPDETAVEKGDRDESLATLDDPNTGLAAEVLVGAMLLSSSRGAWIDGRLTYGGRATWEFGRILGNVHLRDALFVDAMYAFTLQHDGTATVFDDSAYHYVSIAPAYEYTFGEGSPFGVYGQLGGGFVIQSSTFTSQGVVTPIGGFKPLLQYGIGLRATPRIGESGPRISARIEITRLHRGYLDDTFLGGSVGVAF